MVDRTMYLIGAIIRGVATYPFTTAALLAGLLAIWSWYGAYRRRYVTTAEIVSESVLLIVFFLWLCTEA